VPDLAGSVVTVKLSAGVGSTLDVGRPGMLDKSWKVGTSALPNLTIQGDRTDTVSLIGTLDNLQTFLQTDGYVRYSVLTDSTLQMSITAPSIRTTNNETRTTTSNYILDSSSPITKRQVAAGFTYYQQVVGTSAGSGWGTGIYTDDTPVGLAAVHAGLVSSGATAIVKITIRGAQSSFSGSTSNGLATMNYTSWPGSYSLELAPQSSATTIFVMRAIYVDLPPSVMPLLKYTP
jgi:hypothetical protein